MQIFPAICARELKYCVALFLSLRTLLPTLTRFSVSAKISGSVLSHPRNHPMPSPSIFIFLVADIPPPSITPLVRCSRPQVLPEPTRLYSNHPHQSKPNRSLTRGVRTTSFNLEQTHPIYQGPTTNAPQPQSPLMSTPILIGVGTSSPSSHYPPSPRPH